MIRRYLPKSTEELIHWYERYVSPLSLIGGFLADNYILLRRVDLWESNALLFFYLTLAATGIALINLIETGRFTHPWALKAAPFVPVAVQFAFGGLFSGYLSLYSRSAAFPLSWIFVAVLATLMLGNERFRKLYLRFPFQIGVYYAALFSYLIFFLPVVFKRIGPAMFLASGVLSLALMAAFLLGMRRLVPELVARNRSRSFITVGAIFLVLNVFYFLNLIPPLPLALKEGGVYHSVIHEEDGTYLLAGERKPWYRRLIPYGTVFHAVPGDEAVAWSAVFAPSGLSTTILHEWQHFDDAAGEWQTLSTQRYPINGGRDGGYRGYSIKTALPAGRWRVNVITEYGQLIGRITFTVVSASATPPLFETTH